MTARSVSERLTATVHRPPGRPNAKISPGYAAESAALCARSSRQSRRAISLR